MEKRIEELKAKTIGILTSEEFEELAKYRKLTMEKDGSPCEQNITRFEKDINQLIANHEKFNMVAFDIQYLKKILDNENDEVAIIFFEEEYQHPFEEEHDIVFEKDGILYRFCYRINSFGSQTIGALCNDMNRRLDKYICYEVKQVKVPTIRIEYHNIQKEVNATTCKHRNDSS